MNTKNEKLKGSVNKAIGNVKEKVGKAVNSTKLKNEGRAQKAKGYTQSAVGNIKGAAKSVGEKVKHLAD